MDKSHFKQFFRELEHISPAYAGYMIMHLDPYHDQEFRLEGAPSSLNSNSVVLEMKQERTVTASDFGLPVTPGAKWDMHVASFPLSGQLSMFPVNHDQGAVVDNITQRPDLHNGVSTFGPITVSATNGTPTFTNEDATLPSNFIAIGEGPLTFSHNGSTGNRRSRLIGQAFEVVDETPSLYKQGSVTVYEQPSSSRLCRFDTNLEYDDGLGNFIQLPKTASAHEVSLPPTTQEAASLYPSARTWMAKQGAYVISRQNVEEVPFSYPNYYQPIMVGPPNNPSVNPAPRNTYIPENWLRDGFNKTTLQYENLLPVGNSVGVYPFNVSGAYFTGLSAEYGTFRIRTKQFYEIIPESSDRTLVPLASPTLPRDPFLEGLIQKIAEKQPPGFMQTENPKGEVWKKILRTAQHVLEIATPGLATLNPNIGVAVGSAAGTLSAINTLIDSKPQRSSQKKGNPKAAAKQAPTSQKGKKGH